MKDSRCARFHAGATWPATAGDVWTPSDAAGGHLLGVPAVRAPRFAVIGLLAFSATFASALGAVEPSTAQTGEPLSTSQAFKTAADEGRPVEIEDLRTTTDTVYAHPDGTYGRSIAAEPVRFKSGASWRDINLDLHVGESGRIEPKAAPGNVRFSAGGDQPMTEITADGVTLRTDWVDELPEPTLDGPTATYTDVFPDVDLKLTMTTTGTTQVLVVKDRAAALNPALDQIDLPVKVTNGSVDAARGGFEIKDSARRVVARSTQPLMWDSSGEAVVDGEPVEPETDAAVEVRTDGPVAGDEITSIPLDVQANQMTLAPVSAALEGHDVEYPLYIDPSVTYDRSARTMVFKQNPTMEFYNWSNSNGEGVGYQNYNGTSTKRLFFRFTVSGLAGASIISAEFRDKVVYGASCDTTGVELWRTNSFSSATNWSNQPSWVTKLSTASVDPCPEGKQIEWNALSGVRTVASAGGTYIYLGLRATSESNPRAWKRFSSGAELYVKYNRYPSKPTSATANSLACSAGKEHLIGQHSSAFYFRANVSDPDGDSVHGRFYMKNSPTKISGSAAYELPYEGVVSPNRSTAGQVVSADALSKLRAITGTAAGEPIAASTISVRVRAREGAGQELFSKSWEYCYLTFDPSRPEAPNIEMERTATDWGVTLPFVVTSGSTDSASIRWSVNSSAASTATQVTLDAARQAHLKIEGWNSTANRPRVGTNVLRVWAVDKAGNVSESPAVVEFQVSDLQGSTQSSWPFDESFGQSSAPDRGAAGRGVGINVPRVSDGDGISWTQGMWVRRAVLAADGDPHDDLLTFAPGDAPASTNTHVLDPVAQTSSGSFTLAAYLDPSGLGADRQTAVSYGTPGGNDVARLGVVAERLDSDPEGDLTYFYTFSIWDPRASSYVTVRSDVPVELDHDLDLVIGSWDPTSKTLSIEISPEFEAAQVSRSVMEIPDLDGNPLSPAWSVADRLRIGGASSGEAWTGYVDHVSIQSGLPFEETGALLRQEKSGRVLKTCNVLCDGGN